MPHAASAQANLWNSYQGSGGQIELSYAPPTGGQNATLRYLGAAISNGSLPSAIAISKNNGNSWTVDTGSEGMVITADYLYTAFGIDARSFNKPSTQTITYTSSGLTYTGFYQNLNVGLYSSNQQGTGTLAATAAQMPVFVSTSMSVAGGSTTSFLCAPNCTLSAKSLEQMGIGFGRGYPNSYPLPAGAPPRADTNPLLNLTAATGANLGSMAPGYVVTRGGLLLGLTPSQMAGTTFAKLLPISIQPQSNPSAYRVAATLNDWQTPAMTMVIAGAAARTNGTFYGSLLVDTGIGNIELATSTSTDYGFVANPANPGQSSTITVYLPGQGSAGQPLGYTLVYQGDCSSLTPNTCPPYSMPASSLSPVYPTNSGNKPTDGIAGVSPQIQPTPFMNTGIRFLEYFNVVYDPVLGMIGYQVNPSGFGELLPAASPALGLQGAVDIPSGTNVTLPVFLFEQVNNSSAQATVALSTAGSVSISAPISGAIYCSPTGCSTPGLEIAAGRFVLSGLNTYNGATQIDPGATMALSGSGSIAASSGVTANGTFDISGTMAGATIQSLAGGGTVALGSQSLTVAAASGTFTGAIQDGGLAGGAGGALTISGGTQTLGGANTYTGPTTIVPGATLALIAGGQIAHSSQIVADGIFDIAATSAGAMIRSLAGTGAVNLGGQTLTLSNASGSFAGTIGGAGGLAVAGGTQALTGSNTYSGGTSVTGGATLAINADAALGAAAGALSLDNGTLLALGDVASARTLRVLGGGGTLNAAAASISFTGPVTIDGPLNTYGHVVLVKGGAVGGTLAVNGDLNGSDLYVAGSGTLSGVGRVHTPTRVDGSIAPGNSPGTLTFTAPLVLGAGSLSRFAIDGTGTGSGAGNFSRLVLVGPAAGLSANGTLAPQLRGISGSASNSYVPAIGQAFPVIAAQAGISGGYTALLQPDGLAAGTRFDTLYSNNEIVLVVTPAAYGGLQAAGLTESATQVAVGTALDAARPIAGQRMTPGQAALYGPLYTLPAGAIAGTLEQLSPNIYGDALMGARDSWYLIGGAIADQLAARRGGQLARDAQVATDGGRTLWLTGLGQFGTVAGNGNVGYSSSLGGAAGGIDLAIGSDFLAGAAFGFASQSTSAKNAASFSGQSLQLMLYGSANQGITFLEAQAGVLFNEGTATRPLAVYGLQAKGDTGGAGGGGSLRAGVRLQADGWQVEPALTLAGMALSQRGVTETQAGAVGLTVSSAQIGSLQTQLGARAERRFALDRSLSVVPGVQLGWLHEFLDSRATTGAAFIGAPGAPFTTQSATIGRNWAVLGVRAALETAGPVSGYAGYTGMVNGSATAQTVTAGSRVIW
ncbi:MAG: autotransporter domain-containing protein [Acetobacteraceae bacterium]